MRERRYIKWVVVGVAAAILVTIALWIGLLRQRTDTTEIGKLVSPDTASVFQRKDVEAMGLGQLRAYITACEGVRDFQECERAYEKAIRLTQGEKSQFNDFIDLKFGLAELYLNSLWEYGQFGGGEKIPPALEKAMAIYDEIIASQPGSELAAEAQFGKGVVFHNELSGYWNSLHTEDAIREFQKVMNDYPGTDQARKAEQILVALRRNK